MSIVKARRRADSPPPLPPAQLRARLIDDVEHMWIDGVLTRSPYQELLRTLEQPELLKALGDPWHFRLQGDDASPPPSGASIGELYRQSAGSLLLLGELGAGKTTLLLMLARELLARARSDEKQPIPVVFSLSTWRASRRTLDGWLFDELANRYGIERHHARPWLRANLLVLLLDGLDELIEEGRTSCIEAINLYYREHPAVQLVVCCRENEYLAQPARLDLHSVAQIQPLSDQQVEAYFDAVGGQAESTHQVWQTDASMQTLMQTPLLLTMTLLISATGNVSIFPIAKNIYQQCEQILAAYVEYRLRTVDEGGAYSKEQMQHGLGEIARQMQAHNQSGFYLENMQPDWLPTTASRLALSALFGLIAGLAIVPPVALLFGGLGVGIIAGLVSGLLCGLLIWFRSEITPVDNVLGILRGLRGNILVWLIGGLLAGVWGFSVGGLVYGLLVLLLYGLAIWAVVGSDDKGQRERPGGRIWRAGQNGLAIGSLAAVGFGLLGVPFAALYIGLIIGVFAGLAGGGATFLRHFLLRFLFSRSRKNAIPWELTSFLDTAGEHSLLYKIGGGYIFPHRSILDYYAALT